MQRRLFGFGFLACLLVGCTHMQQGQGPQAPNASMRLAAAADSVSASLLELKKIQAAATPPTYKKRLPNPDTWGMTTPASIDWSGPIGPLVKAIAKASHFHFHKLGNAPAIPVLVTISAKDTPLGYILRDIDFQAGKQADVVVNPRKRTIELRYAKA